MQTTSRLAVALIALIFASCAPPGYRKAAAACRDVRAGMTEAQVLQIMGAPQARDEPSARPGQLWLRYYEGGDLAPIIVILDRSEGKYVVGPGAACGA